MKVAYATTKLERSCTDLGAMKRAYGDDTSKALRRRIGELRAATCIDDLFIGTGRWERLAANRTGQLSARLGKNWRLIVREETTESVLVVEIVDYH